MARVIANPYARHTHSCGATVEFDLADICVNQKAETTAELRYVVCPACGKKFNATRLRWRTPKVDRLK